jgi:hypothetical protein
VVGGVVSVECEAEKMRVGLLVLEHAAINTTEG